MIRGCAHAQGTPERNARPRKAFFRRAQGPLERLEIREQALALLLAGAWPHPLGLHIEKEDLEGEPGGLERGGMPRGPFGRRGAIHRNQDPQPPALLRYAHRVGRGP